MYLCECYEYNVFVIMNVYNFDKGNRTARHPQRNNLESDLSQSLTKRNSTFSSSFYCCRHSLLARLLEWPAYVFVFIMMKTAFFIRANFNVCFFSSFQIFQIAYVIIKAANSPRPGQQCVMFENYVVCFDEVLELLKEDKICPLLKVDIIEVLNFCGLVFQLDRQIRVVKVLITNTCLATSTHLHKQILFTLSLPSDNNM